MFAGINMFWARLGLILARAKFSILAHKMHHNARQSDNNSCLWPITLWPSKYLHESGLMREEKEYLDKTLQEIDWNSMPTWLPKEYTMGDFPDGHPCSYQPHPIRLNYTVFHVNSILIHCSANKSLILFC